MAERYGSNFLNWYQTLIDVFIPDIPDDNNSFSVAWPGHLGIREIHEL